jgi:tryptophan synthase
MSMQRGGVDIIELGVPFSDPIADGPTIQESSHVRLQFVSFILLITNSMRLRYRMVWT